MAQDGTLRLAPAPAPSDPGLSKDQLQRQMAVARESISHTVDEIKETVVHQYEAVKETISETLDWREQVKKRPLQWGAGAVGAGFVAGYGIAAMVKGNRDAAAGNDQEETKKRVASAISAASQTLSARGSIAEKDKDDSGPGIFDRFKETQTYDRLKQEAASVGNRFVDEISKKAQAVILPAAIAWVGGWLERLVPEQKSAGMKRAG
jgi:hypothetical protein